MARSATPPTVMLPREPEHSGVIVNSAGANRIDHIPYGRPDLWTRASSAAGGKSYERAGRVERQCCHVFVEVLPVVSLLKEIHLNVRRVENR